jgi:hypothetical protein
MSASIFSFASLRLRRASKTALPCQDWSQQELAELYRVRDRLVQSGIAISVEVGLTDEGEPWAVYVQHGSGDPFVHIARLDGQIVVANLMAEVVYRGADFRAITDQMLESAPLLMPQTGRAGRKVVLHPRSVFTAFVAAAVVLCEFARSIDVAKAAEGEERSTNETRSVFPQIFDRLLGRDPNWAHVGATATAASLFTAAAAAVLLTDSSDEDRDLARHVADVASILDVKVVPASANDANDGDDVAAQSAQSVTIPEAEERGDVAQWLDGAKRAAVSKGDIVAEVIEAPPSPVFDAGQPPSHLPDLDPVAAPRIVRTGAAALPASEPNLPATVVADVPESKTYSARPQELSAKDINLVADAILVARLPADFRDRAAVLNAIDRALDNSSQSIEPIVPVVEAPAQSKAPPIANSSTIKINSVEGEWVLHTKPTGVVTSGLTSGVHDIVHIAERNTTIAGFRFNEDYLLVDGAIDRTDWIKTIHIQGDDVTIVSVSGSVISLIDTQGLIA